MISIDKTIALPSQRLATKYNNAALAWDLATGLAFLLLVAMLSVLVYGLSRGLDLTDEGFYLLYANHPFSPHASSFGCYLSKLPQLMASQVMNLRLHYVCAQIASSLILAFGFQNWVEDYLKFDRRQSTCILVTAAVTGLMGMSILGTTFGYNGLVTFFVLTSVGFLFLSLAAQNVGKIQKSWVFVTSSGFFLGLAFFAKCSSCVMFFFVELFCILILSKSRRTSTVIFHVFGFAVALLVFFTFFEPLNVWLPTFKNWVFEVEFGGHGTHAPGAIFANTYLSLYKHKLEIAVLIASTVVGGVLVKAKAKSLNKVVLTLAVPLFMVACILIQRLHGGVQSFWHSSLLYLPMAFLFLGGSICILAFPPRELKPFFKFLVGLCLLAVMPLATSVGTDTPLLWHALLSFAPIAVFCGYLGLFLSNQIKLPLLAPFVLSSFLILTGVQFADGYVLRPRCAGPLYTQSVMTSEVPQISALRLEPQLSNFIVESYRILRKNGFKDGDPLIGIFDAPGLVWAVNGTSPGYGWYSAMENCSGLNNYFLPRLSIGRNSNLFVLVKNVDGSPSLDEHTRGLLNQSGIHFPADFTLVGKVYQPHIYWDAGTTGFFYKRKP